MASGRAWLLRDQTGDTAGPWRPSMKQFDALRSIPSRVGTAGMCFEKGGIRAAFKDRARPRSNPELVPSLIDLAWSMSGAT